MAVARVVASAVAQAPFTKRRSCPLSRVPASRAAEDHSARVAHAWIDDRKAWAVGSPPLSRM